MFGAHLQMCTSLVRHLVLTLLEPVNLRQPNLDLCLHLWDTGTMVCTESRTPGHVTRAGVMMWSHTMSDFNIIIIMTIRDQSSLEGMIYTAACCAVVYSNVLSGCALPVKVKQQTQVTWKLSLGRSAGSVCTGLFLVENPLRTSHRWQQK